MTSCSSHPKDDGNGVKISLTPLPLRNHAGRTGATLVEMMVGMVLFALVASGIATSLIQLRKQSENAMCQIMAQSVAEGLLEQIRRAGFSTLSDFSPADVVKPDDCPSSGTEIAGLTPPPSPVPLVTYRSVELKFIAVGTGNFAEVQTSNLYWANGPDAFVNVGARVDASDLTSSVLGVVLDMDYRNASGQIVRPRRYMPMRVNITRTLNADSNAVHITLRYQWQQPDRRAGALVYFPVRELRTVVPKVSTY